MIEDSLITRDNKRISSFLKSLDQMLDDIENLTKNYRPILGGERYLTDKEVADKLKLSTEHYKIIVMKDVFLIAC